MAVLRYLASIDLNQNELKQHVLHRLPFPPASPVTGQIYYNTTAGLPFFWNGTTWVPFGSGSGSGGDWAPPDAEYLLGMGHSGLPNARVVTNTPTITWDLSTTGQARANIPSDSVTNTHLRDSTGTSVIGRSTSTPGDPEDITASADNHVLRRLGGVLGFGTLPTDSLMDDAVTNAKLANMPAWTIKARNSSTAGDPQDIMSTDVPSGTPVSDDLLLGWKAAGSLVKFTVDQITSLVPVYTDEQAQDAVGGILTDSSSIDFTYNDSANTITAAVIPGGVDHALLANLSSDSHTQYFLLSGRDGDTPQVIRNNIQTTPTLGLRITNNTPSSSSIPHQYSPFLEFMGSGYTTSSRNHAWRIENRVSGGITLGSTLTFSEQSSDDITPTVAMSLARGGQLRLPITGSGAGILIGGDVHLYRGTQDRLDLGSGDSLQINTSGKLILPYGSAYNGTITIGSFWIDTGANNTALLVRGPGTTHTSGNYHIMDLYRDWNASATSSGRLFGMQFVVEAVGSNQYTHGLALTGIEGFSVHSGTNSMAGAAALLCGVENRNTGTLTNAYGVHLFSLKATTGGGHVTNAYGIFVGDAFSAITANNQRRVGIFFSTPMPSQGLYSGVRVFNIWVGYDSTNPRDGFAFGAGADVEVYRKNTGRLGVTGKVDASQGFSSNGTDGITQTISIIDQAGVTHTMEFSGGILVSYSSNIGGGG